ncbi:hypothetical protein CAXC1_10017 [Candidatus Xenohaliotis californiensis]|uniref:Uncharacterized protein n=1 Tax=Candidatus Xenohaliotis californiensis TaxID=84677 RepID=A0ABP0EV09_9RICK|nr:hypothetical protein CAXC1_10017 [Candidatus Xenohaliotis californiensis]
MQFIQNFLNLFYSSNDKENLNTDENDSNSQNAEIKNGLWYMLLDTKKIDSNNDPIIIHVTDTNGEFKISYIENNVQSIFDVDSHNIENNDSIHNALYNLQTPGKNDTVTIGYNSSSEEDVCFKMNIKNNACYLTSAPSFDDICVKGNFDADCSNVTFVAFDDGYTDAIHILHIMVL